MGIGDKIDAAKGKVKEAVGDATDDREMEREGRRDQATSKLSQAGDKVKDAAEDVKDALRK